MRSQRLVTLPDFLPGPGMQHRRRAYVCKNVRQLDDEDMRRPARETQQSMAAHCTATASLGWGASLKYPLSKASLGSNRASTSSMNQHSSSRLSRPSRKTFSVSYILCFTFVTSREYALRPDKADSIKSSSLLVPGGLLNMNLERTLGCDLIWKGG